MLNLLANVLMFTLIPVATEELLVEAHETPDMPFTTAIFFVGFLLLIAIEKML